jgi:Protein of unknown function (DUF2971)
LRGLLEIGFEQCGAVVWEEIRAMRLYHFVKEKYGIINLEMRRLKLARIADLNDPFEFAPACPDAKARKVIADFKRQAHESIGLLCFSSFRDNPVQWSHYAEGHRGMCLGFDVPDSYVTKVEYAPNRPIADMTKLFANEMSGREEIERWLSVKYEHWSYEQEWRAAFKLNPEYRQSDGNYYEAFGPNLQLAEVMIGERSTITRLDLNNLLGEIADDVEISKARLSFRKTYRIVRLRGTKYW